MSFRKLLITGGLGFIGSNFIRYLLSRYTDISVTNFDALTYAGNPDNLQDFESDSRYHFVHADLTDAIRVDREVSKGYDAIVHFAAESHVDRSIADPGRFVQTNVVGTHHLLEAARKSNIQRIIHISTDEVYGSLEAHDPAFTELTPLAPNSPYSASKASSDLLARAAYHTYGLPVIITRCSNNYGPFQYPEKLIPTIITKAMAGQPIPVYGDGLNVRDWLHVGDHCAAVDLVLHKGAPGEVYNIGGENERTNLEVVKSILQTLGKPEGLITFVNDRLGHDRRYAINASKIKSELGWRPELAFDEGIKQTVDWYVRHESWWKAIVARQERINGKESS
ncbi:dTDP-glucose 4,6-dehydratase [Paenibacillus sp. GCM10012307]|uniref:dTDP-glucose 4,6-dehydratase n=1 Tax=Paenibacillus roseus TaxID=2798579 RepID=A0A934MR33_9BACL|nr:dTDP-glucose 4,6-dehydratase [Paenibacillus roseus]MBJ6363821.1 dTDP-glucose 4,6-dehydratase [Paenibacillus roseus]